MSVTCQTVNVYATGNLAINSTPIGARIWLAPHLGAFVDQGVNTNNTLTVVVGSYDVKLVLAGYQDWIDTTGTITVTDGLTTTVNATLTLSTGSVTISSAPSGAEIYIAAQPGTPVDQLVTTSRAGTTISGLAPGSYNYKLTLAGYADITGTFSITANTNTPVSATFAGSATITSTPSGAEIYIAAQPGTPIDQLVTTPSTITGLTAATPLATTIYNYKLTLAGYADVNGTFTATAGSTISVPVTMLTPANITATNVTVTTSETPCMIGTCTVTVIVRWSNSGQTDGTVIPNIKIDNVSQVPHTSRTVPAGSFIDETFLVTGLSAAAHTICPDPN